MESTAFQARGYGAFEVGSGACSTPVIADRGDEACVVVVRTAEPLDVGSRFEFGGLTWEIVRARDLLRGFVAWPVLRTTVD
jgi:hypothetical protein